MIGFICNTCTISLIIYSSIASAQTEVVAYKSTLARPSARNSRYGIGGRRCGGCVSHRQELSTSLSYCCCCEPEFDPALLLKIEPTRCSGLAEHALRPGAVAARWGSKQRPRAARAEASRVGRWWSWLDSNGVTLFAQQYDRGTCCELLLAINTWYVVVFFLSFFVVLRVPFLVPFCSFLSFRLVVFRLILVSPSSLYFRFLAFLGGGFCYSVISPRRHPPPARSLRA